MATPTATSSCGAHDHVDDEDSVEMDMAFDPTLASCCKREEHEYKKAMKLKAVLTAHDPTSSAVRMRQQLFQPPSTTSLVPPTVDGIVRLIPPASESVDSDSDSDSDDLDEDEMDMEILLAARRKQLEQQLEQSARDAADGYGVVVDTKLERLVHELQDEPDVPRVVLVVDSSAAMPPEFRSVMCSKMATVAKKFRGTKFHAVVAAERADDDTLCQLRLPSKSCLAAFRRGERVDSIALDQTVLVTQVEALWETRYLPWLSKCNVVACERVHSPPAKQSQSSRSRKPADEMESDIRGFDCGMEGCRLRFSYEHEHVGTSQQTKDEIAAWRQASKSCNR
uniref:VWFA domain-containing protein n=1 Tax=Peronospora matthiolae TaxID=2874970 RepID=A0AAV1UA04_9STRA